MSGNARAPGTRGRQRIAGFPAHQKPLCLPRVSRLVFLLPSLSSPSFPLPSRIEMLVKPISGIFLASFGSKCRYLGQRT